RRSHGCAANPRSRRFLTRFLAALRVCGGSRMGALTISNRTFAAAGNELEHPVDALGRVRWRSTLDTRAVDRREDGEPIGFKGHAAVFNSRTWIGSKSWGFWEQIDPRAFRKTLNEADVRFLINHDPNLLLA